VANTAAVAVGTQLLLRVRVVGVDPGQLGVQLLEHGVRAAIEPVRIASDQEADTQRFLGSPTLRVDGADVEPGADARADFGLKCRIYRFDGTQSPAPPDRWLRRALG
jgi:hypothetical protein